MSLSYEIGAHNKSSSYQKYSTPKNGTLHGLLSVFTEIVLWMLYITIQAWLLSEYHLNSTLSSICKYGRKSPSTKFYVPVLMKKESEAHAGSTGVG